ncbi:MAG: hypothetical protein KJ667_00855 [Alphaproteobacteria bacterium]|nr:hypothetical protein [Alphaproteobacteria bacterium]
MKFLKNLFNRQTSFYVSLDTLANLVNPVHTFTTLDKSPANVAKGWDELTDWTRIGFDLEREKGTHATALYITMRHIAASIALAGKGADKNPAGVYISKDDLAVLRATYWQIAGAADGLRTMAATQKKRPDMRISTDEDGREWATPDYSNVIAIYNRPGANHRAAADNLEEIQRRLDSFFVHQSLRPAPDAKVTSYAASLRLYN